MIRNPWKAAGLAAALAAAGLAISPLAVAQAVTGTCLLYTSDAADE